MLGGGPSWEAGGRGPRQWAAPGACYLAAAAAGRGAADAEAPPARPPARPRAQVAKPAFASKAPQLDAAQRGMLRPEDAARLEREGKEVRRRRRGAQCAAAARGGWGAAG